MNLLGVDLFGWKLIIEEKDVPELDFSGLLDTFFMIPIIFLIFVLILAIIIKS